MGKIRDIFERAGYRGISLPHDTDEVTLTVPHYSGFQKSSAVSMHRQTVYIKPLHREAINNLQSNPPPTEILPQYLQNFLQTLSRMPDRDKIDHIHNFVVANMDYDILEAATEKKVDTNYADVAQKYKSGDCDNHATLMTLLMLKSGIPADSIAWVAAEVKYKTEGHKEKGQHAVCMVDINGIGYLMDLNLQRLHLPRANKNPPEGGFFVFEIY